MPQARQSDILHYVLARNLQCYALEIGSNGHFHPAFPVQNIVASRISRYHGHGVLPYESPSKATISAQDQALYHRDMVQCIR